MGTGSLHYHRTVAAAPVQIVPVRCTAFCQLSFVVAPALDPLPGLLVFPDFLNGQNQVLDGINGRRQHGNLRCEIRQHGRMHVTVHETRENAFCTEIHDLSSLAPQSRSLFLTAHPGDPAILHRHGLGIGFFLIRRKNLTIDIERIVLHFMPPQYIHHKCTDGL